MDKTSNLDQRHFLCIGISAPPKSGAESIQFAKCLKALNLKGKTITLVTTPVPKRGWSSIDPALVSYNEFVHQIIIHSDGSGSFTQRLNAFLSNSLVVPDVHFRFYKDVSRLADKVKSKPDVIYARGMPFSSAVLGAELAKKFNVPSVLQMSDPFTINPYLDIKRPAAMRQLEHDCFSQYSIIGFTTEQTRKRYAGMYPELSDRFRVYPNVYDPEECNELAALPERFTIRFTGNLYGERTLFPLFKALAILKSRNSSFDAEMIVSGRVGDEILNKMKEVDPGYLKLEDPVDYHESLSKQRNAHLLVSVDKPSAVPEDGMFLPSKLLDYMCANRPVLNITSEASASAAFINETGIGRNFSHNDETDIAAYIAEIYDACKNGRIDHGQGRIAVEYSSNTIAERILKDLAEL